MLDEHNRAVGKYPVMDNFAVKRAASLKVKIFMLVCLTTQVSALYVGR